MKVGIVGSGFVGATAGYALVMKGVGREIVLVDKNAARAVAEADDIRHAVPFAHPLAIRAGDYPDLAGCQVVVVCAGVGQKPGETRLQLLQRNAAVFREVIPAVVKQAPDAVLVIATNPVDVMTHLATRFAAACGVPRGRVFGSGTTLDTARFRSLIGTHVGVDAHHVHAYVIGEHGDSEVLTWSLATIGNLSLEAFCRLRGINLTDAARAVVDEKVRRAAYTIINGKGATYYGVGAALARIVDVILHDQRSVLTVCTPTDNVVGVRDVTVALPRLVGGQGVLETFPLPLNESETAGLRASAGVIRAALDELGDNLYDAIDTMAALDLDALPSVRTKIVATLGPASRDPAVLRRLMDAGVNVFRLNFSHGTHDEHSAALADIRTLSRETGRHVGVLQDLCGPKMRLGPIPGDLVECPLGEEFNLVMDRTSDSPRDLTCSYRELPNDLKPGETVLFADGTVGMQVSDVASGRARLKVTLPGRLRSRQGLNLPGSELAVKSLTDKDLRDLDWTARHADDVQFVGFSFVRTPEDVAWLRRELAARNCPGKIVVKIEKPQAVRHLEAIVAATDAVMVARGDLGVEMAVQRVPAIQKQVIALCNATHRPVITATQMLNSMEHSSRPTRAEASDVFNAVLDGTDAVMLSGESAVGEYPVESVATMRQICAEAEAYLKAVGMPQHVAPASLAGFVEPLTEAAVDAACLAAQRLDAPLIVVATDSGRTALALSNRRPSAAVLALTHTEAVARLLAVCWGVTPLVVPAGAQTDQELAVAIDWARSRGLVRPGQRVVLLRGEMPGGGKSRAVVAREVT